jgi:hypothetical protein
MPLASRGLAILAEKLKTNRSGNQQTWDDLVAHSK